MSKIRGEQVKDDSLTGTDIIESTLIVTKLRDADDDTRVDVELNADEDKIRFSTAGVERLVIDDDGGIAFGNSSMSGVPGSWNFFNFKGGGVRIVANNFYCDNNRGVLWGDSSVSVKGNAGAGSESLTVRANYNAYIHVDGINDAVGIGTITPSASLHVSGTTYTEGGVKLKLTDVNSNTTLTTDQHVIRCVQTSAITLTLPSRVAASNHVYVIKDALGNAGTSSISITPDGSDTIDGMSSVTINANHGKLTIMCDGINGWMIIG
jgi:hypothetical protein